MDNLVNQAGNPAAAGAAVESANVFAFAPGPETGGSAASEQKDAGAVDAQRSAGAQGKEQRKEPTQPTQQKKAQPGQKDIGHAFKLESERVRKQERAKAEADYRKKLADDPVRAVGLRMVNAIMKETGVSEAQAIQEADKRFYDGIAAREKISPAMARALFKDEAPSQQIKAAEAEADGKTEPKADPEGTEPDGNPNEQRVASIVETLSSMKMPEGFDMAAAVADEHFIELLLDEDYTPAAAVRTYHAEQRAKQAEEKAQKAPQEVADQLKARSAMPQQGKPSTPAGTPNFMAMSREEYRAYQRSHGLKR